MTSPLDRAASIARGKRCRGRAMRCNLGAGIDAKQTNLIIERSLIEQAVDPAQPPIRPVKKETAQRRNGPQGP